VRRLDVGAFLQEKPDENGEGDDGGGQWGKWGPLQKINLLK